MSKKKNTLKDLDDFLKQQAAMLVKPVPVTPGGDAITLEPIVTPLEKADLHATELSAAGVTRALQQLAAKQPGTFRQELYDIMLKTLESLPASTAEDKMLINTLLYLKNSSEWKDSIRTYWKNKN